MQLIIENKKRSLEKLKQKYVIAEIIDVTSKGEMPWVKFSPFYPHNNIPVPYSKITATSVEGIWQGLKVFEGADIDLSKFNISNMKNIKRSVRKYGKVKGHKAGILGNNLLSYQEARFEIYLPSYKWVLDNCLQDEINQLRKIVNTNDLILLDYEVNNNVYDLSKPLSHAYLIKCYIEGNWPEKTA